MTMNPNPNQNQLNEVAYNDPGNFDVWFNPTEHTFVVGCHVDHKGAAATQHNPRGGARVQRYRFLPGAETIVPSEFRYVIQQYECSDPECRQSAGTKLCHKDHPAVIVGGQCPQLVRLDPKTKKGFEHIKPNPIFSGEFVEQRAVDATGRVFFEDNREKIARAQAKAEATAGKK